MYFVSLSSPYVVFPASLVVIPRFQEQSPESLLSIHGQLSFVNLVSCHESAFEVRDALVHVALVLKSVVVELSDAVGIALVPLPDVDPRVGHAASCVG